MIPRNSVIIIDHDRRIFLKNAVTSVLSQTLNKELYEVIVVKGYDSELDQWLTQKGIIVVKETNTSYGQKFLKGLEKSRGEIISLLDDDDQFSSHKLEIVNNFFENYPNAGYLHNHFKKIDKEGKIIENNYWLMEKRRMLTGQVKYTDKVGISHSLYNAGDFNHSSISFKREILTLPYTEMIQISGSFDTLLFFLALINRKDLLFSPENLTFYRVHASNSSKKSSMESKVQYFKKQIHNYSLISNIIGESNKDKTLEALIKYKIIETKINIQILSGLSKRGLIYALKELIEIRPIVTVNKILRIFLVFSYLCSSRLTKSLFFSRI